MQRRQKIETKLENQRAKVNEELRGVRKRVSMRERKRDTQRLIVKGRFFDHVLKRLASNPPDCPAASPKFRDWLDAAFDVFVSRADHRLLFGLPPHDVSSSAGPSPTASRDDPIPGWKPKKHEGAWAAIFVGDPSILPTELVGLSIVVNPSSGDSWIAKVLEVVERSDRRVLVRRTDPPPTS